MRMSPKEGRQRQVRFTLRRDLFDHFESIPAGAETIDRVEFLLRIGIMHATAYSAGVGPLQRLTGAQTAQLGDDERSRGPQAPPASKARSGWDFGGIAAVPESAAA
jgi:hypothetical protein